MTFRDTQGEDQGYTRRRSGICIVELRDIEVKVRDIQVKVMDIEGEGQ